MEALLHAIPEAAQTPYAFASYVIASIIFLIAGYKLRMAKLLTNRLELVPEQERKRVLELAAQTVLPDNISPEQWIKLNKQRSLFLICIATMLIAFALLTIALLNPSSSQLTATLSENTRNMEEKIKKAITDAEEDRRRSEALGKLLSSDKGQGG